MFLLNSAAFRQAVGNIFKTSFRVFRALVVEPIQWIVQSPLLQRFLHSRLFTLVLRLLVKPLAWTALIWCITPGSWWRHYPFETGAANVSGGRFAAEFAARTDSRRGGRR